MSQEPARKVSNIKKCSVYQLLIQKCVEELPEAIERRKLKDIRSFEETIQHLRIQGCFYLTHCYGDANEMVRQMSAQHELQLTKHPYDVYHQMTEEEIAHLQKLQNEAIPKFFLAHPKERLDYTTETAAWPMPMMSDQLLTHRRNLLRNPNNILISVRNEAYQLFYVCASDRVSFTKTPNIQLDDNKANAYHGKRSLRYVSSYEEAIEFMNELRRECPIPVWSKITFLSTHTKYKGRNKKKSALDYECITNHNVQEEGYIVSKEFEALLLLCFKVKSRKRPDAVKKLVHWLIYFNCVSDAHDFVETDRVRKGEKKTLTTTRKRPEKKQVEQIDENELGS